MKYLLLPLLLLLFGCSSSINYSVEMSTECLKKSDPTYRCVRKYGVRHDTVAICDTSKRCAEICTKYRQNAASERQ